jgi:PAS domain S-box-containing protein
MSAAAGQPQRVAPGSSGGRSAANAARAVKDVAALTLDDRGMVCDCNRAGEALFRYSRSELVWRHVSMVLPQLAGLEMMANGEPNPRLRFLCRIGRQFQAVTHDGRRFASELFLSLLDSKGHGRLSLIVRPIEDVVGDGMPAVVVA